MRDVDPVQRRFLLVEDVDLVAVAYQRTLSRYGLVLLAGTVAEAWLAIASVRLTGLVTDIALPDGSGLDVAREARARVPGLPILIVSGAVDGDRLDAADELGATYLLKPVTAEQLGRFAERAIARQQRESRLVAAWIERYGLSAAEAITLRLSLQGRKRDEIALSRGVQLSTVRSQIRALLGKVGAQSTAEMVATFYRELASEPQL